MRNFTTILPFGFTHTYVKSMILRGIYLQMLAGYFTFRIIELFILIPLPAAVQWPVASVMFTAALQRAAGQPDLQISDQNIYFPLPRQAWVTARDLRLSCDNQNLTNRNGEMDGRQFSRIKLCRGTDRWKAICQKNTRNWCKACPSHLSGMFHSSLPTISLFVRQYTLKPTKYNKMQNRFQWGVGFYLNKSKWKFIEGFDNKKCAGWLPSVTVTATMSDMDSSQVFYYVLQSFCKLKKSNKRRYEEILLTFWLHSKA